MADTIGGGAGGKTTALQQLLCWLSRLRKLLTMCIAGHPNLNLTSEEKRVYGQFFKAADPDGFEVVSGDVAVKFFEKTRLPPDVLGQVRLGVYSYAHAC